MGLHSYEGTSEVSSDLEQAIGAVEGVPFRPGVGLGEPLLIVNSIY